MKIATTTGDFSSYPISDTERITRLHDAGFRYIDLSLYRIADYKNEYMKSDWKDRVAELKACADQLGMTFVQSHSPGVNPLCRDDHWQLAVDSTIRSIEICGMLGIPNTVVHSGFQPGIGKEEYFEKNLDFFRLLYPAMEQNNVNVLIENSTRANMGDMWFFLTGEEMREFIEYADHPLLHGCWDTGHANIEGHQYSDLTALGDHLRAVHISDNRGRMDEHIPPFTGTTSFDEVMHGLLDIGFKGPFTLETEMTLWPYDCWLGARRRFGDDEPLLQPPLSLKQMYEKVLYETAKYMLETYNCFEE